MSKPSSRGRHLAGHSTAATTTTGVLDYLRHAIARETLLELYVEASRGRFVCRAVVQQLSPIAQQVCIRLLCTDGSFPLAGVKVWAALKAAAFDDMLLELYEWAIVTEKLANTSTMTTPTSESLGGGGVELQMSTPFRQGFLQSMTNLDASPWLAISPQQIIALEEEAREKPQPIITRNDLERYTQQQWDNVLHFLVGATGHEDPPRAVVHFLLQTALMQPDPEFKGPEDDAPLVITERGYDFMLQDNHQQVWHFVVQYLKSLESQEKSEQLIREALTLLICLSFARVGEAYLASSLKKESRTMVKHLSLFGLLYTRKIGKATLFYPTRIAMQLIGGERTSGDSNNENTTLASALWSLSASTLEQALANPHPKESSHLAIIVQTNFQVCAYTTSELHVSMLGLFCDVQSIRRLPNIVFLHMTRDSVKAAFHLGIQARQILRFLEKHAHPKLRELAQSNSTTLGITAQCPIPSNVVDQIWLWHRERSRVQLTEVYQHQCLMEGEFNVVVQYAKDRDAHMWSSERRQCVMIKYEYAERIRQFAHQWRAQTAKRGRD